MWQRTPGNTRTRWLQEAGSRVTHLAAQLRRRPSAKTERILLGISLVVFAAAAVAAARNFPAADHDIRWGLLLAVGLLGMPANIALNAAEFQVIARFVGQRVSMGRAAEVTILGSAANLLPIPGSTLVRVQALVANEARYREAVAASIAVGVLSLGVNLTLAGASQVQRAPVLVTAGFIAAGVAVVGVAVTVIVSASDKRTSARLSFVAIGLEVLYATVSAVRLWLILLALGLDVGLAAAFALTAAGSLATAVGFFPAGLGIREVLVGVVSPLVGVPLAVGMAGAVAQRLFAFVVLAIAATVVMLRRRGHSPG